MKKEKLYRIFSHMPTLRTERLILRPMSKEDTNDMFEYARGEEVTRYLLWSPHPSAAYTQDYLQYIESRYRLGDLYDWSVLLADSGKMIGTCGFTRIGKPAGRDRLCSQSRLSRMRLRDRSGKKGVAVRL